jgi:hypothetical protein
LSPGCSRGEGSGCASGTLNVPDCWAGAFDLQPDFFAAIPGPNSLLIREQSGADYESFSDGISFDIEDLGAILGGTDDAGLLCPCSTTTAQCSSTCPPCSHQLIVDLPPAVAPLGVPLPPTPNPSIVHATLYLEHSCRTQNLALYAMGSVALNPDGTCVPPVGTTTIVCGTPATLPFDADAGASSDASVTTDAGVGASASPKIGTSTISFHDLFDGDENESNAQKRLSYADFDLYFADPREACSGGLGPPPPCRAHLTGNFNFYFERGQPAQPFP